MTDGIKCCNKMRLYPVTMVCTPFKVAGMMCSRCGELHVVSGKIKEVILTLFYTGRVIVDDELANTLDANGVKEDII